MVGFNRHSSRTREGRKTLRSNGCEAPGRLFHLMANDNIGRCFTTPGMYRFSDSEKRGHPMPAFPRGVNLKGGRNAAPVLAEMAREFYAPIIPVVVELRQRSLSLRQIARALEQRGTRPRMGWH